MGGLLVESLSEQNCTRVGASNARKMDSAECSIETLARPHQVCETIRRRIATTRSISDEDLMTMSLLSSCNEAEDAIQFVTYKSMYAELEGQLTRLSMTTDEWASVFAARRSQALAMETVGTPAFYKEKLRMESGIPCSLAEEDQRARWKHPLSQLLTYIALHSTCDVEERVSAVIGSVVRTDVRRLEDLRSAYAFLPIRAPSPRNPH